MIIKRIFDVMFSFLLLLILLPFLLIVLILIKIDSDGPCIFKQERIGKDEIPFIIYKFRTMFIEQAENKYLLSLKNDSRITRVGKFLRKYKLDEFPQLINVLKGEMSLVGPRPEVRKYVEFYAKEEKKFIFSVTPGVTDLSSLYFYNEHVFLENSKDSESVYINEILPQKKEFYKKYVCERTFMLDIKIIFLTAFRCIGFMKK